MPLQTIDRGTAGNPSDTFKVGVAFDTCQANDQYLDQNKAGTIADWAAIATVTPSAAGQLFNLAQHTSGGLGGGTLMAFAGSVTDNGGTEKNCLGGYYLKRINYSAITPEMFGCIGSTTREGATTDYGVQLQKMLDAAQTGDINKIEMLPLSYKTTTTLAITTAPVHLSGSRPRGEAYPGAITPVRGTELVWGGGFAAVLFIGNQNMGGVIEHLEIYGNAEATYCLHADTVVHWRFTDIWCQHSKLTAFYLDARYGTCSWNVIEQLRASNGYLTSASSCIIVNGYNGGYNACHNTFINTIIEHAGDAVGLHLGFCDNCNFIDTYILTGTASYPGHPASTQPGVGYFSSGGSYAYSNFFYHLQAGNNGYVEPSGIYSGVYNIAQIYGYCTDNAQPLPVFDSEVGSFYISNGNSQLGMRQVGIGVNASSYPLEVATLQTNKRGTSAKFGKSGYVATYDDELYLLDGAILNASGTVIAKITGTGSAFKMEGSALRLYSFDSMTADVSVPITDAVKAFTVKKVSGTWSYGLCGVAESAVATGFGTPTGNARLINFPGATATLVQTSGALADLLTELKAKGLIQA